MTIKTKFKKKIEFSKTALVFSGGASKAAAFHLGVCLALRDKGFSFLRGPYKDFEHTSPPPNAYIYPRPLALPHEIGTYVGSSAGAFLVTLIASGISVESIIKSFAGEVKLSLGDDIESIPRISYKDIFHLSIPKLSNIKKNFKVSPLLSKTWESTLLRNLRLPGLFSTIGIKNYLEKYVLKTKNFNELLPDLFIIGTQLDHSRKMIFGRYGTEKTQDGYYQYATNVSIGDAVGASMSLPPIFTPFLIEHEEEKKRFYMDGEIRETLSTHVASENNCDLIISSYTHQPYHYKEEIGSLINYGISAIAIQAIYQSIEQKVYQSQVEHEKNAILIEVLKDFFSKNKLPTQILDNLIETLEDKLKFSSQTKYIYIHPEPKDRDMFFGDHFTLKPEILQSIMTVGYKRAMSELRKYEFVPKSKDFSLGIAS